MINNSFGCVALDRVWIYMSYCVRCLMWPLVSASVSTSLNRISVQWCNWIGNEPTETAPNFNCQTPSINSMLTKMSQNYWTFSGMRELCRETERPYSAHVTYIWTQPLLLIVIKLPFQIIRVSFDTKPTTTLRVLALNSLFSPNIHLLAYCTCKMREKLWKGIVI